MRYLIVLFLFLGACAKDNSSGSIAAPTPIADAETCTGVINRSFIDTQLSKAVEFYSDCTGAIPSCDTVFTYDIIEMDNTGGQLIVNVQSTTPSTNCRSFEAGQSYACGFAVENYGQEMSGIYMNCGGETIYLDNDHGVR